MRFIKSLTQVQTREKEKYGFRACDLALLNRERIKTPLTFVITTDLWDDFFRKIKYKIDFLIKNTSVNELYSNIRRLILNERFSDIFLAELREVYEILIGGDNYKEMINNNDEAYATMILSPNYIERSETYEGFIQNIKGLEELQKAIKELYAMAFLEDAINYRLINNIKEFKLGIILQEMAAPKAIAIAYSHDPKKEDHAVVFGYKGFIDIKDIVPKDYFLVKKDFLQIEDSLITEQSKIILREHNELKVMEYNEPRQSINDKEVLEAARLAKRASLLLDNPVKLHIIIPKKESINNDFLVSWIDRYAIIKEEINSTNPTEDKRIINNSNNDFDNINVKKDNDQLKKSLTIIKHELNKKLGFQNLSLEELAGVLSLKSIEEANKLKAILAIKEKIDYDKEVSEEEKELIMNYLTNL